MPEETPNASQKLPGSSWTCFKRLHFWRIFDKFSSSYPDISAKCSAQRNSFSDMIIQNWSYTLKLGSGKFSANSVVWAARFSRLKGAKNINNLLHSKIKFPVHPYYSSSRKGFPSHMSRYLHFKQTFFGKSAWHFRPNVEARGKPSTWFPRGKLVKTEASSAVYL